jgi:hypothetical protein
MVQLQEHGEGKKTWGHRSMAMLQKKVHGREMTKTVKSKKKKKKSIGGKNEL